MQDIKGLGIPTMPMMNCIIKNTTVANNVEFKRHCKAMIGMHKPTILALLKTRMSDQNNLIEELDYTKKIQYPVVRRSRGLVILCNKDNLTINDISITS